MMWPHERPEAHFTSHRFLLDKEGDLNRAHPVPRVSGYKRGSGVTEAGVSLS
jgi:hypothetical protein